MMKDVFLCFSLYFCSLVLGNSYFNGDVYFDNRYVQDSSSYEISSTSLLGCAVHCQGDETCLSFVHNCNGEKCQLFSKIFLSEFHDVTETGNKLFKKRNDESICDVPPVAIPKGRLIYVDGLKQGSKAQFLCDDFYFPTVLYGVCNGGVWTDLGSPCVNVASPRYYFLTVGRVSPGRCVFLPAITPTESSGEEILLKKDANNLPLSITFNSNDEVIARNSKINGAWGTEELETPIWPLVPGQHVNMTICTEESQFRMFVDRVEVFTYSHRLPHTDVPRIEVDGFIVKGIFFTE